MDVVEIVRAALGFVLVLFVPGYAATWALFPDDSEIDMIERIALAVGLSIALVVLIIYVLNIAVGVKITMMNSLLVISAITIISAGAYYQRKSTSTDEPKKPVGKAKTTPKEG